RIRHQPRGHRTGRYLRPACRTRPRTGALPRGDPLTHAVAGRGDARRLAHPDDAGRDDPRRADPGGPGEPGGGRAREVRGAPARGGRGGGEGVVTREPPASAAVPGVRLGTVEEALAETRAGRPVLVADSPDRETEAGGVVAARGVAAGWVGWTMR